MSKSKVLPLKVGQEGKAVLSGTKQLSKTKVNANEHQVQLKDNSVRVIGKSSVKPIESPSPRRRSPGRPRKDLSKSRSPGRTPSRNRSNRSAKSPSRKSTTKSRTSKSRSPGPSRTRSTSSSRRIAANAKQQNSVSKKPSGDSAMESNNRAVNTTRPLADTPSSSSTNMSEGLVSRKSARVAALQTARVAGVVTPGLISEGMVEVDSKPNQKNNSSGKSKKVRSDHHFLGTLWAFIATLLTPAVILCLYLMCNKQSCSVSKLPVFPVRLSSYVDVEAISMFFGWLAFQGVLYALPVGRLVEGQPLRDGTRLKYRINGPFAFVVSMISLGSLLFYYPRVADVVYQKQFPIAVTAIAFSYIFSLLLYVKSRWAPMYRLNSQTTSRNFIYSYFMGRELNPRPLGFELKVFLELRPGLIAWSALNVIFVWKDYVGHGGQLSYPLLLSATLQIFYVLDALWFEEAVLSTMDVTTEGLGFMLVFGDLAFVPFVFPMASRFLLEHRRILPWYTLSGIFVLFVVGYIIFRASNLQKDVFRRNPFNPSVANLDTINTGSPKKILAGGWWGWVRHPNYFGDFLIALSICLPTGFTNVLPYSYLIYLVILLVHRAIRDEGFCRHKYGAAWDEYCSRVRHRIVKYVF